MSGPLQTGFIAQPTRRAPWHAHSGHLFTPQDSTRQAGMEGAGCDQDGNAPQEQQQPYHMHGTGLLNLPGVLLAQIWKEQSVDDRKALCCTARHLRECAEINALMTDCLLLINPDGSIAPETDLQRWPRHAPPPKRLDIQCQPHAKIEPGRAAGLLPFLEQCMQQEHAQRLLRGVQQLHCERNPPIVGGLLDAWNLSEGDATGVASLLGTLCPGLASFRLGATFSALIPFMQPWQVLRSLSREGGITQAEVTAVAQLTQLTSLALDHSGYVAAAINVGCLSALAGLQSLSLGSMDVTGLPLVAQACSSLTQLKLRFVWYSAPEPTDPLQPPQIPCTWPSLVELGLDSVGAGVASTVLPTPQASPKLERLLPIASETNWLALWPSLQSIKLYLTADSDEGLLESIEYLKVDAACLAQCPVQCQSLELLFLEPRALCPELGPALRPLGECLTHFALHVADADDDVIARGGWVQAIHQALPRVHGLRVRSVDPVVGLPEWLQSPALRQVEFESLHDPTFVQLRELLFACAAARATHTDQGVLKVLLTPMTDDELLPFATDFWQRLMVGAAGPVSVVVADNFGTDLLQL